MFFTRSQELCSENEWKDFFFLPPLHSSQLSVSALLQVVWKQAKIPWSTFKKQKKREKRKTKRIFPSSFILWLGVKSNVEGNIHLAFVLFLLSVFKQNFTLESVFLRHKQKSFPCFHLPVTGWWMEKAKKMKKNVFNVLIFKHRNAICSIQPFLPWKSVCFATLYVFTLVLFLACKEYFLLNFSFRKKRKLRMVKGAKESRKRLDIQYFFS